MSHEKLEAFLRKEGVNARILMFKKHTMTVEDAEKQLGISRERIIKSMLFVDEKGVPIVGIVTGDKKVSEEKLMKVYARKVKIARPTAVKSLTGYEIGALPPVGHKKKIRTFIDPKVMTFDKVYGGGGAINALLEIDPRDIKRLTDAEVVDISEG
jgi:Cys-tRNA(Pro) deacylase